MNSFVYLVVNQFVVRLVLSLPVFHVIRGSKQFVAVLRALCALRGEHSRSLFLKESSMGIGILVLLVVAVVVIVWVIGR